MTINVLLYPNFTVLDAFGPVEVLGSLPGREMRYLSPDGGIVRSGQGVPVETEVMETMAPGGVLLIPGGMGSRPLAKDEAFLARLKALAEQADHVLCVCTGSALLARTGLLDGRRATSNKTAFDWVRSCGPDVLWQRQTRWVADGKYYTSAGVSAGTDMALGFVRDLFGAEEAETICRRMEYHWNRDADNDIF